MHYKFPYIENIYEILPFIRERKEFVVAEKDGGYTVINYVVAMEDTFPEITDWASAVLRECRGIVFNSINGQVIARRYHKFFNAGERKETGPQFVDLRQPHIILEKLDGSMITPIPLRDGVRWGTKMGVTDVAAPVEQFVAANENYLEFANYCFAQDKTPIFEWCSRKQKIVLDYAEDQLILTAVRHNYTGAYDHYGHMLAHATQFRIPVVRALHASYNSISEFVEYVRSLQDTEGFVVRFDTGHMVKVKCEWYLQLHRALDVMRFEKNVLALILDEKVDDLIPLLKEDDARVVREYQKAVYSGIEHVAEYLEAIYNRILSEMKSKEKREFAVHFVRSERKEYQPFLFKLWNSKESVRQQLIAALKQSCSSQNRLENNRWMMNYAVMNAGVAQEE